MSDSKAGLVVDSREPSKYKKLLSAYGVEFETQQLMTGDYICYNKEEPEIQVCIERKRLDDLISSYYGKRLESQFSRLSEQKFAVLIITGNMAEASKRIPFSVMPQLVEEVISLAVVKYNFRSVIWMVNGVSDVHEKSFITLVKIFQKIISGHLDRIPQKKLSIHKDPRVNMLMSMFGLDKTSALNLLKKFGTVKAILNLHDAEFLKVRGIGPAKMKRIRFILDESFNKGNFKVKQGNKMCKKCGKLMNVVKMLSGDTYICRPCMLSPKK